MEQNVNNDFFSEILEQSAIKVAVSHPNTLKHCVAVDLRCSNQLNRNKLGFKPSKNNVFGCYGFKH